MKEDEPNWFPKWEDELPTPEDLMPLSQTLITPDLAIAFDIRPTNNHHPPPPISAISAPNSQPNSGEFDSSAGADEPARTLKRPRLVWTPQLHKRFVDAVAHLGIKNAVPKTIMQLMSVDGLTRENVASHLQKYRLYLKRMQGINSGGGGGGGGGGGCGGDPATDHLFASSPVPAHFLQRGNSDHYLGYVPVAAQMAALQPRYGQIGHFASPRNGGFDPMFVTRANQHTGHRVGNAGHGAVHGSVQSGYGDELESANGRKVLTLFPTGDD